MGIRFLHRPIITVLVLLAVLGTFGRPVRGESAPPLEIGITPYYSTRLLFEQYEPLRSHLAATLRREVFLVTAKDFRAFAQRTRERAYRFLFSVPHLGRLAEVDDGYRPLLQMKAKLRGTFLVRQDSSSRVLADLRHRSVSTPDPLAIITMMGEQALAAAGLRPGETVATVSKPSHNAAVLSVLNGETDAALVWHSTVASMDRDTAGRLRVLGDTEEIPVFILFLAAPGVPKEEADAVRDAVLGFAATEAGQVFQKQTAYGSLAPVRSEELAPLDSYLPAVRRALAVP